MSLLVARAFCVLVVTALVPFHVGLFLVLAEEPDELADLRVLIADDYRAAWAGRLP